MGFKDIVWFFEEQAFRDFMRYFMSKLWFQKSWFYILAVFLGFLPRAFVEITVFFWKIYSQFMYNFHYLSKELTLQNGVNASDCVLMLLIVFWLLFYYWERKRRHILILLADKQRIESVTLKLLPVFFGNFRQNP